MRHDLAVDGGHTRFALDHSAHEQDKTPGPEDTDSRVSGPSLLRLSRENVRRVPSTVRRPYFDPALLGPGILHLGCGSFHRAHQALLTQEAIEAEAGDHTRSLPAWGIVGVSLRDNAVVRALDRQDGLYTVLERGPESTSATVVGTLGQRLFGPQEPEILRRSMASPSIRIVTLTVTPAGYCLDPVTGLLDSHDPTIVADLQTPYRRTAIGLLVQALHDRRTAGIAPPVVMSCDNLASNSRVLRRMCIDFAALRDDELARWIEGYVQFPSTMVDRIVPTPTAEDRSYAAAVTGLSDDATVSAEPFRQWVIEHFDGPKPRWDAAGAQFVPDVRPWEASKLRLLNGGHLAVAFFGLLAGCVTVAETMALPGCAHFVREFMCAEQKPTLPSSDHDIDAYAGQLIARWRNGGIRHCLLRVGRDPSIKMPARLLASLQENRHARRPAPCTVLAVAAWMRCTAGFDDTGRPLSLSDPLAERLRLLAQEAGSNADALVNRMLAVTEVFGPDLAQDEELRKDLCRAVFALKTFGARGVLASFTRGGSNA